MAIITDELPLGQVTHGLLNFCSSSTLGQVITRFCYRSPQQEEDLLHTVLLDSAALYRARCKNGHQQNVRYIGVVRYFWSPLNWSRTV